MSDLLSTYTADFKYTVQDVKSKLDEVPGLDGESRHAQLKDIEGSIDELKEIIGSIEAEILSLPSNSRATHNSTLRSFKSQLQSHETSLKQYEDDEDRRQLFGASSKAGTSAGGFSDHDQRQELLRTNASLGRTSDRLKETQRVANETEDVGANILENLRGQREQLLNSRNTLMEADGYVDKSIRTLRTMSRRMAANKMLSYCIIAVLILLIFLVLVSKFK